MTFLTQPLISFDEPRVVLGVEDEDMVRRTLTRVLNQAGYRTLEAHHGSEALSMVALAYPYLHLVITDVLMPELDGRALGQRLRERYPAFPCSIFQPIRPTICSIGALRPHTRHTCRSRSIRRSCFG